jgi:hypothetical protein
VPDEQLVQAAAATAEYKPAAQSAQVLEALAPVTDEYDPAAQLRQPVDPVAAWNEPAAQLVHAAAVAAE